MLSLKFGTYMKDFLGIHDYKESVYKFDSMMIEKKIWILKINIIENEQTIMIIEIKYWYIWLYKLL